MNEITARFASVAERAKNDQARLDQAVQDELNSLNDASAPPPPAPDLYDVDTPKSATNDARGRAIAYVSRLIAAYTIARRSPGGYKVGITNRIDYLRREMSIMQSSGPEGETLARRWDLLVGDLV